MKKIMSIASIALFTVFAASTNALTVDLTKVAPQKTLKADCSVPNFTMTFINNLQGGLKINHVNGTVDFMQDGLPYTLPINSDLTAVPYGYQVFAVKGNSACHSSVKFALESVRTTGGEVVGNALKPTLGCVLIENAPQAGKTTTKAISQWSASNYICY